MNNLKSLLHKLVGLYLIGAFTTFSLITDTFANNTTTNNSNMQAVVPGGGKINIPGSDMDQGDRIITIFKNFINYALGFLAFIAFAMLIWGGYKMVASGGDEEAYKEGIKILKNAAMGIAFISVSWFLVTFIFFAIGAVIG